MIYEGKEKNTESVPIVKEVLLKQQLAFSISWKKNQN